MSDHWSGGVRAGCKCRPCSGQRAKRAANMRALRHRRATGQAALVDIAPVSAHLVQLRAQGVPYSAVAALLRIDVASVAAWSRPAVGQRIHAATARRILAVQPPPPGEVLVERRSGLLDATGSRRQLQALAYAAHPLADVVTWTGLNESTLRQIMSGTRVRVAAATGRAITAAYNDHGARPGTSAVDRDKARAAGWVGAAAWDDNTIRNPHAAPNLGEDADIPADYIDGPGVDAALSWNRLAYERLTPGGRAEFFRRADLAWLTLAEIARLLHIHESTLGWHAVRAREWAAAQKAPAA